MYRLNSQGRKPLQTRHSNRFFVPFLGPQCTPCLIKVIKRQDYEEERGPSRNGGSLFVLLSRCSRGFFLAFQHVSGEWQELTGDWMRGRWFWKGIYHVPNAVVVFWWKLRYFPLRRFFFYPVLKEPSCFWDFECHRCGATVWCWDSGCGDVLGLLREVVCLSATHTVHSTMGCTVGVRWMITDLFSLPLRSYFQHTTNGF